MVMLMKMTWTEALEPGHYRAEVSHLLMKHLFIIEASRVRNMSDEEIIEKFQGLPPADAASMLIEEASA